MVNRERISLIDSSERIGRWVMSTFFVFHPGQPLFDAQTGLALDLTPVVPDPAPLARRATLPARTERVPLLGVELHDKLLLDLGVDDLPGRERVHQDLHLAG